MMVKLAQKNGMKLINMVRREEAKDMLEELGAEYVVVTSRKGWEEEVAKLIKKLKISIAFDCIAGDMPGTMMQLLPPNSTTYVYGGLSDKPVGNLPHLDMRYHNKKVKGFFLKTWLTRGGMIRTILRLRE